MRRIYHKHFCKFVMLSVFTLFFLYFSYVYAANHTVDLVVDTKVVDYACGPVQALAINDRIPGPILHFKEGDYLTINVHNHLNEGTTIHWHGLLVPWNMDGVEGVSQKAISPGDVFSYKFKLRQSGTYWYHAHTGLQEQQGLYGSFIIDPLKSPSYSYTKDYVIMLSDWSNTTPTQIFANLKKDGGYYSPRFPLQPSLAHFIHDYWKASPQEQHMLISDYGMMQKMRMGIYDISDVAYDAFLLNGKTKTNPWTGNVKVGDIVRLRFIGAGASSVFRVKIPGTVMKVIHVQGHDVEPYTVNDFSLAPGETLDVLITIREEKPYIIYAESADTLGAAYGGLITSPHQKVDVESVLPFPAPPPSTKMHSAMGHEGRMLGTSLKAENKLHNHMTHIGSAGSLSWKKPKQITSLKSSESPHLLNTDVSAQKNTPSSEPIEEQTKETMVVHNPQTGGTKYQNLKSSFKTNDPHKPVKVITMELSGYMNRYMWFINGLPENESQPILIEPGKRYRLVFKNVTMMHHPMHIHGHFFILRNGHGEYDPLLHTIDVPPEATVVADFDANVDGQWYFHCHNLYHMAAGMARVFQYSNFHNENRSKFQNKSYTLLDYDKELNVRKHPIGHHPEIHQASFLDIGVDPYRNVQKGSLNALVGWDTNKLQLYSEDAEISKGKVKNADLDIFYWHSLSNFWAIKGGANYFYKPSHKPYWQPGAGIEGVLPYFINTNLRAYLHKSSVKFDIQVSRDTQLTNKLFISTGVRGILATKTVQLDEIGSGLNNVEYLIKPYIMLAPGLALFSEFSFTRNYEALRKILRKKGESVNERTLTFGISLTL